MKRSILKTLALTLVAAVLFAGCSTEETEEKSRKKKKETTEETTEDTTESSEEEETMTMSSSEETEEPETSASSEADPVEDSLTLYEAYISGNAEVKFRADSSFTQYLFLTSALTDGGAYTAQGIVDAITEVDDDDTWPMVSDGQWEYRYIDCGEDGVPELCADITFQAEGSSEYFDLTLIIKEIDGELVTCYAADSWSRCWVMVFDNGTISVSGSGGFALHITDYSFIDADGEYHFFYGCEVNDYPEYLYVDLGGGKYKDLDFSNLDIDGFQVNCFYFEQEYTARQRYYSYCFFDGTGYTYDPSDYEDDNPYKQVFSNEGLSVYTPDEMEKILNERAKEINYPG